MSFKRTNRCNQKYRCNFGRKTFLENVDNTPIKHLEENLSNDNEIANEKFSEIEKQIENLKEHINGFKNNISKYNKHIGIGFGKVAVFSESFSHNLDEVATKRYVKNIQIENESKYKTLEQKFDDNKKNFEEYQNKTLEGLIGIDEKFFELRDRISLLENSLDSMVIVEQIKKLVRQ
jgi:flagellar motility protein MotE (MotC chaperone)